MNTKPKQSGGNVTTGVPSPGFYTYPAKQAALSDEEKSPAGPRRELDVSTEGQQPVALLELSLMGDDRASSEEDH